jgi:hypothetical protein
LLQDGFGFVGSESEQPEAFPKDLATLVVMSDALSGAEAIAFVNSVLLGLPADRIFSREQYYRAGAVSEVCRKLYEMMAEKKAKNEDAPHLDGLIDAANQVMSEYYRRAFRFML